MNCRQNSQRTDGQQSHSRFFSDDFAVLPNIDRRPVHACNLARDLGGAAQGAPNGGGELPGFLLHLSFRHGPCSNNTGFLPELSYTLHLSAKRRYTFEIAAVQRSNVQGSTPDKIRSEAVPDVPPLRSAQNVKLRSSSLMILYTAVRFINYETFDQRSTQKIITKRTVHLPGLHIKQPTL
jgi:hypothetical protein